MSEAWEAQRAKYIKSINTPITARAAEVLWDLSAEFQHGWIGYVPGRAWFIDRAQRPGWGDEVNALTEAGIEAAKDTIGCLSTGLKHSTGSHTLEWEIDPSGRVVLQAFVYTPAPKGEPAWKSKKDRRIARLVIGPTGRALAEVFGRFPLLGGEPWEGKRHDGRPSDQYDYTWSVLSDAAHACGVVLPPRPVDAPERPPLRLPRSQRKLGGVA